VIVGFPGETEQDFLDTYNFLNDLDISYLHVFTYSERPDTAAITLAGSVPGNLRHERTAKLRILSEKKRRYFYEQHLGSVHKVLFEQDAEEGLLHGFTANYIKVSVKFDPLLVRELKEVKLNSINEKGLVEIEEIMEIIGH
jgi:threonylcarbamoyladenosine tRNA methylthiotransferase MtaB